MPSYSVILRNEYYEAAKEMADDKGLSIEKLVELALSVYQLIEVLPYPQYTKLINLLTEHKTPKCLSSAFVGQAEPGSGKKFKPGQTLIYEPSFAEDKQRGAIVFEGHPLRYQDMVLFLAHIAPQKGHCIVTTFKGRVVTMLHTNDFRPPTDDEI